MKAVFVTKRLAFGSGITKWRDVEQLHKLGITHVVNLRWNLHDKKVRQFECLWLPFKDDKKLRPRWESATTLGIGVSRSDEASLGSCTALQEICLSPLASRLTLGVATSNESWLAELRGRIHLETPSLKSLRIVRRFSRMTRSHEDFLIIGK